MAGTYNFTIDQGSDWSIECTYKDENDSPINLTGMSLESKARKNKEDRSSSFDFTLVITNASNGVFTMSLSSATSSALDLSKLDKFFYDVELDTGSQIRRLFQGIVTINREVTR